MTSVQDKHEIKPFEVVYDEEYGCVRAVLNGPLDRSVVGPFYTELGRVANENQCRRIISDLRNAEIIANTFDMYFEAREMKHKNILPSFKRAIVISRDKAGYEFWENVCVNLGFPEVKIFEDYETALRWVLAD